MDQHVKAPPLHFVQIGDLHLTEAGLENHLDFGKIVDELNRNADDRIDFVYLPGDNADDGTPEQFRLVREGLSRLRPPWHAIPGDHDFKPRSLDNFYAGLGTQKLPYATDVAGCRCIFLDVVSRGQGGPDFKLGAARILWLRGQLDAARSEGKTSVVFMHAYPADLGEEAQEVSALIDESGAVLVAMGHTHYNEISNDGRTIYAATRSTGQIEEGPVGFVFVAIDGGVVNWRFKPLASSWPFAMITSPADRRLATAGPQSTKPGEIRASAWGAVPIARAEFRIDGGEWHPMYGGDRGRFAASHAGSNDRFKLEVRVVDQEGATDVDAIEVGPALPARNGHTGSDTSTIGAWPERHLFGTQLGPNRNGRKW
jgi:predicted phosphodiesterase